MASKLNALLGATIGTLALSGTALASPPCTAPCVVTSNYNVVTHTVGTVNGLKADIFSWYDANHLPRTVALKQEGNGNSGHGGYAIQMTYVLPTNNPTPHYYTVTVNAEKSSDGGFGYFVSHERYRWFGNDSQGNQILDTIAGHIFGKDDSPLGLGFPVNVVNVTTSSGTRASAAIRYSMNYSHYGLINPIAVDPDTGVDAKPLPKTRSSYKLYTLPVKLTWVFEALTNSPRIDVKVGFNYVPKADLVNFDVRGPYGVMMFDNGADGTVDTAQWGDQAYLFNPSTSPVTRSTSWDWSVPNTGARFNALIAGGYEMGLFEPKNVAKSATVDDYTNERGYNTASFAAAGGTSYDSCSIQTPQTLPSDGSWPFQSEQYSLPCPTTNTQSAIKTALTTPATYKKIAWGSSAYYGSSLTDVYNGQSSFPFNGFPTSKTLNYSVCLVLGATISGGLTESLSGAYQVGNPQKIRANCSTATL
jgi:hypothetical protein